MGGTPAARPVGGMAVCEGVMMRGAARWSVAVRTPEGSIAMLTGDVPAWSERVTRVPVVRGVAALAESMVLGVRAMTWSVAQTVEGRQRARPVSLGRTIALALALVAGIFFVLPATIAKAVAGGHHAVVFNLVDSGMRLAIFFAYLVLIGRLAEVRRLFEYHGAEHMAVATHEAGAPLTVEAAATRSTRHPRCGTTFMLVVMVVAIAAHAAIGSRAWPELLASRVLVVPLVAGVAFELLRLADRPSARWLLAPGLALQALTTRRPAADQLDVALAALRAVVADDDLLRFLEQQEEQEDDEDQDEQSSTDVHASPPFGRPATL